MKPTKRELAATTLTRALLDARLEITHLRAEMAGQRHRHEQLLAAMVANTEAMPALLQRHDADQARVTFFREEALKFRTMYETLRDERKRAKKAARRR